MNIKWAYMIGEIFMDWVQNSLNPAKTSWKSTAHSRRPFSSYECSLYVRLCRPTRRYSYCASLVTLLTIFSYLIELSLNRSNIFGKILVICYRKSISPNQSFAGRSSPKFSLEGCSNFTDEYIVFLFNWNISF